MGRVEPDASQGGHGETVVKREAASPASLSGSAAEDEEHSTQHNKTTTINSDKTNLKIKIKMEDKSKCSKCLVSTLIFLLTLDANLNALKNYISLNIVTFKSIDLILHLTLYDASRPYLGSRALNWGFLPARC